MTTSKRRLLSLILLMPLLLADTGRDARPGGDPSQARIVVGPDRAVDSGEGAPLTEPWLAAHPTRPGHLVGTAIVVREGPQGDTPETFVPPVTDCATFVSADGGESWTRRDLGFEVCADPWVAVGPDGSAYFVGVAAERADEFEAALYFARSPDDGWSWEAPVRLPGGGHDHPSVQVGPEGVLHVASSRLVRGAGGRLVAPVWTAVSRDGGRSFDEPVERIPSNLNLQTNSGTVLPDGGLLIPFRDFMRNVDDFRSPEGLLERPRSWVLRSDDGGDSFGPALFVTEECGSGWDYLVSDHSDRETRGRAYLLCAVGGSSRESSEGVQVLASADGGAGSASRPRWTEADRSCPRCPCPPSRRAPTPRSEAGRSSGGPPGATTAAWPPTRTERSTSSGPTPGTAASPCGRPTSRSSGEHRGRLRGRELADLASGQQRASGGVPPG